MSKEFNYYTVNFLIARQFSLFFHQHVRILQPIDFKSILFVVKKLNFVYKNHQSTHS